MTTAVDSSVLLDVLTGDPRFGAASAEALRAAYDGGALVACDVVWAEVRAHFADEASFHRAVETLGLRFDAVSAEAADLAGHLWRASRRARAKGSPRHRVVADFLIGAHAARQADAFLTRDDGFYRIHFKGLRLVAPRTSR